MGTRHSITDPVTVHMEYAPGSLVQGERYDKPLKDALPEMVVDALRQQVKALEAAALKMYRAAMEMAAGEWSHFDCVLCESAADGPHDEHTTHTPDCLIPGLLERTDE